jgi:outer membrane protein assembly factor BamB
MKRSRRALLQAAALVGSLGIAGCNENRNGPNNGNNGNGNGGSGTPTGSATGPGTGGATDSPTEASTPTPDPIGDVENWNKLQYDNFNTGWVDLNHGPFESSTVNWSVDLEGGAGLQPAFDEERVYVPTRKMLYAIDRASGEVVWSFEAEEGPVATPLLRAGFVYTVTGGGVVKLNAAEGWNALNYRFNSQIDNLLSVVAPSAPVHFNGMVIFNLIVKTSGDLSKQTTRIVALDLDGNEQWVSTEPTPDPNYMSGREATTPANGFAPTPAITGSGPETGSVPTPSPTPSPTPTPETSTPSPTPSPTPETPTPTPTASPTPTPSPTPRPSSMTTSTLYVTHGWDKQDATIYALNPNNGNRNWFKDYKGKGWSSISALRGRLFFADRYADVFEAGSGDKVVRRTLNPPPNAYACAIGREHTFMSSRTYEGNEGTLFAVNDVGRVDWSFSGEGNLFVPTATNDTVYVASASGELFALDSADGLVRWNQDLGVSAPAIASGASISRNEIFVVAGTTDSAKLVSVSPVR